MAGFYQYNLLGVCRANGFFVHATAEVTAGWASHVWKCLRTTVRASHSLHGRRLPISATRMRISTRGLILRQCHNLSSISFDDEDDEEPVEDTVDPVSDEVRSKSRAEFTTVYDVIDTMEENLSEAKNVLFAAGMVKIDRDAFADHLSRLKDMLPVQLERASALMREAERRLRTAQAQANSIVTSAQSKAAQIVEEAQERAQFLAGQENVTALAKKKAREIVADAQAKSDKLTQGADKYCTNVMDGLKQQLDKLEIGRAHV